jgi:LmbE family N-acetylglucosaminyl deacetylase
MARHEDDGAHVLTLMTVQAHPDDETLWTGGVMARYAAEGLRVVCVTCTRGENGEIVAPDLNTPQNQDRLGDIRADELARALAHLGPIENFWLDYRDSGMMGAPANDHPESLWKADLDQAAGRLVRIVRDVRPDVMVTFNDFGGNGHPDHIRAAQVAKAAYTRAGDPDAYPEQLAGADAVAPWTPSKLYQVVRTTNRASKVRRLLSTDGVAAIPVLLRLGMTWRPSNERVRSSRAKQQGTVTTQVDVRPWLDAKRLALGEHRTQIAENRDAKRYMVIPLELFTLAASRVSTTAPETDLFAGLRGPR